MLKSSVLSFNSFIHASRLPFWKLCLDEIWFCFTTVQISRKKSVFFSGRILTSPARAIIYGYGKERIFLSKNGITKKHTPNVVLFALLSSSWMSWCFWSSKRQQNHPIWSWSSDLFLVELNSCACHLVWKIKGMPMPWISNGYPWICRLSQSNVWRASNIKLAEISNGYPWPSSVPVQYWLVEISKLSREPCTSNEHPWLSSAPVQPWRVSRKAPKKNRASFTLFYALKPPRKVVKFSYSSFFAARHVVEPSFYWRSNSRISSWNLELRISWQALYLVSLKGDFTCSAHWKWWFICGADHLWDSFCLAGTAFGEVGGWLLLLRALETMFHMWSGSRMRFILRGRRRIWWS